MGNPALARNTDDGRRFYPWKGESFWSVTELASAIPKYLHAHYAKMASELALAEILARGPYSRAIAIVHRLARAGYADVAERQARGELRSIKLHKQTERQLALRWLKGAADRHRDAAAAVGTEVHDEAERLVLREALSASGALQAGGPLVPWPAHLSGHEAAFRAFLADFEPEFLATEATVFNRTQGYAGTLDAVMRIRAERLVARIVARGSRVPSWLAALDPAAKPSILTDYKSGAIRSEVSVQLSAYARGEFIGGADKVTEHPMPFVMAGAVLQIAAKGYRFRFVRIDDVPFNTFLYAIEVYRYLHEHAATVLLEDLSPVIESKEVA
jgi:hypothetical protein